MVSKTAKIIVVVCALALLLAILANTILYPKHKNSTPTTELNTTDNIPIQNISQTNVSEVSGSNNSSQLVVTHDNYTNYSGNITADNAEVLAWDHKLGYNDGLRNISPNKYIDMHHSILEHAKNDHDKALLQAQINAYEVGWYEGQYARLIKQTTNETSM